MRTIAVGCGSFSNRSNLTRHTISIHIQRGTTFHEPFPCPVCRRLGQQDYIVNSPSGWSHHVETNHGKQNAPVLYSGKTYTEKAPRVRNLKSRSVPKMEGRTARCFFCASMYAPGSGFSSHFNKAHKNRGLFKQPFPCPECRKQENIPDTLISNYHDWLSHMSEVHGRDGQSGREVFFFFFVFLFLFCLYFVCVCVFFLDCVCF